MTESHGNENIGQVLQEKTIEPAKEKEKARLEQDCNEYLQNSNRTSVSDFLNFTSNMTLLIGGERHKTKSGTEITSSNSLPNKDTQASIVFEIRKTGKLLSVAEIRVESADKSERLSAYLSAINYPSPYIVNASSLKTTPKFDSYITGGERSFFVAYGRTKFGGK